MDINNFRFAFDDVVIYSNGKSELKLHPVRLRDFYLFLAAAECLMLERSRDPNPIVALSMSRLNYLYYMAKADETYLLRFDMLLKLSLGKKDDRDFRIKYEYEDNGDAVFVIGESVYDNNDFENLREIIAKQNEFELPDESIQWTIREKMAEAREFKSRMSGNKYASIEDQIIALSIYTGWELDKIYSMTVRKFIRSIRRANHMIYQDAYLNASLSGMVEFKDKSVIKSWLADIDEKDNADVTMSLEELQGKVSMESAKNHPDS